MSREKQIEEMKKDLSECHTIDEWAAREYGEAYTDFDATAEKMLDRGWRKQVEGAWETFPSIGNKYRCSLCKEKSERRHKYCPNCGAKMKGKNDEKTD